MGALGQGYDRDYGSTYEACVPLSPYLSFLVLNEMTLDPCLSPSLSLHLLLSGSLWSGFAMSLGFPSSIGAVDSEASGVFTNCSCCEPAGFVYFCC